MARPIRRIPGTTRIEAFSDGVLAIIITLLIFEVRLPEVGPNATNAQMIDAFVSIAPKLASFAVSFGAIAIFWVNHHSFFAGIRDTDWMLLWANNLLLFWLAIVPFTTAVLGDHLGQPIAVAIYALNLGLAGASFTLMGYYVLFKARLVDPRISDGARRIEVKRSVLGSLLYLAAAPIGLVAPLVSELLFVVIPIGFIVPGLFGRVGTELRAFAEVPAGPEEI